MDSLTSCFKPLFYLLILSYGILINQHCASQEVPRRHTNFQLSNEELLNLVQYHTFQYFWEGAESNSGLARERIHLDDLDNGKHTVTAGGSGFGMMAILVGIHRKFITRQEGFERFKKMIDWLFKADSFHGVWPHWWKGDTGKVSPFDEMDDGGDLVETAYLVQGLLCAREYFKSGNRLERALSQKIDQQWKAIEWNWHRKDGKNILYWHWSPNYGWAKDLPIEGYNECLITYILAASSPTHGVPEEVYNKGWARNGAIINSPNQQQYGYHLGLRHSTHMPYGGPLFWAHYSYLGLDPRNLTDKYTNYWEHNKNHTLINRKYCIENPKGYHGYGSNCWGLTASYSMSGYDSHSPKNDLGVISPTAALSSMPYTPNETMEVIRHLYYDLGNKVWGKYGFYDAFSEQNNWYPKRYLAIDQGPIVVMIENHRSALLWRLFMSCPEVQRGLKKLGFTSPSIIKN